jgi:hypothetical protein
MCSPFVDLQNKKGRKRAVLSSPELLHDRLVAASYKALFGALLHLAISPK